MHPGLRPLRRRHSPNTEGRADGKKAGNEIESRPFLVPDCRRKCSHVFVRHRLLRLSFPLIECPPGFADSKMPMLLALYRQRAACVITLACDLDVFARGIPTGFAAIFLVRSNVTKTRYVRALAVLLICHFAISFFKSIVLFQRLSIASS